MSSVNCCDKKCLRKLSIEDINYCESSFKNMEQTTRRNLILGYLHMHSKPIHSGGFETEFYAGGKCVCKEAWLLAHDVKPDSFRRIYAEFGNGTLRLEHGHSGSKRPTQKTKDCIAWLEFFVSCVGQHQPDQATIHLPSCFSISSIYQKMVEESNSFGVESVSQSQFYSVFHHEFPDVVIPKVSFGTVIIKLNGIWVLKIG